MCQPDGDRRRPGPGKAGYVIGAILIIVGIVGAASPGSSSGSRASRTRSTTSSGSRSTRSGPIDLDEGDYVIYGESGGGDAVSAVLRQRLRMRPAGEEGRRGLNVSTLRGRSSPTTSATGPVRAQLHGRDPRGRATYEIRAAGSPGRRHDGHRRTRRSPATWSAAIVGRLHHRRPRRPGRRHPPDRHRRPSSQVPPAQLAGRPRGRPRRRPARHVEPGPAGAPPEPGARPLPPGYDRRPARRRLPTAARLRPAGRPTGSLPARWATCRRASRSSGTRRDELGPDDEDARRTVHEAIELLDSGEGRVAEWDGEGEVTVHQWLKLAVLLLFRVAGHGDHRARARSSTPTSSR